MTASNTDLTSLLFFDVVTARQEPDYSKLPASVQRALTTKINPSNYDSLQQAYAEEGIFQPEISKIIGIAMGMLMPVAENRLEVVAYVPSKGDDTEAAIINQFYSAVERVKVKRKEDGRGDVYLAGFNVKGFDIPFLSKRSVVNGIDIPEWLQVQGKKPWEVPVLDIMEAWNYGGRYGNVSLQLMAHAFHVEVEDIPYSIADKLYQTGINKHVDIMGGSVTELTATMKLAMKITGNN